MMTPSAGTQDKASCPTKVFSLAVAALILTYPFLVYFGWQRISPRLIMGAAIVLFGLRLLFAASRLSRSQCKELAEPWLFPAAFLLIAFAIGRRTLILYWPATISTALLFAFGRTLAHPPTVVELFARVQKSILTDEEIAYCRNVTRIWCLFFMANGSIALWLAWGGSLREWTLYNGMISYLLIGTLMASEYFYRHWRFRPEGHLLSNWMNRWTH
jgi:uncharacterized membrane protein